LKVKRGAQAAVLPTFLHQKDVKKMTECGAKGLHNAKSVAIFRSG
jgi:hypothetical protein